MATLPTKCPKCGKSNTLEMAGERQGGFSGGKAAAGAILLGPIGLIGGLFGKKKFNINAQTVVMSSKNSDLRLVGF